MKDELMKPRWKVIADYPDNLFLVGDILPRGQDEGEAFTKWFDEEMGSKYPHLFRRLAWWEERAEGEMPEFVKVLKDRSYWRIDGDEYDEDAKEVSVEYPKTGTIIKVSEGYKWHDLTVMYLIQEADEWVEIHAEDLEPATSQEYTQFINSK